MELISPHKGALALTKATSLILESNAISEEFGLSLSNSQALALAEHHLATLKEQGRIEFGRGILPALIFTFCDSPFIAPAQYEETLEELLECFYLLKNESQEQLADNELLDLMEKLYNGQCQGSLALMRDGLYSFFHGHANKSPKNFQQLINFIWPNTPQDEEALIEN